jgi:hypothetical protein
VNNWLGAQRLRILVPLIGLVSLAAAAMGGLAYDLAFAGSSSAHHFHWRELLFGSVLVTLGSVTGIKVRHQEPEPDSA